MVKINNSIVETSPLVVAKYGILSPAVKVITDSNSDWLSQFTYDTVDGSVTSVNSTIMGASPAKSHTVVQANTDENLRTYFPFDVQTTVESSLMGNNPAALLLQAQNALNVVLQKNIEAEFWDGVLAKDLTNDLAVKGNRYLASVNAVDLTPASFFSGVRAKHAQAILERALGNHTIGSAGVLHMTRDVAAVLDLSNDDDTLVTSLGNTVVAGVGYSGRGPDGSDPGFEKTWMYATGPVTVRLGDVAVTPEQVGQAVDISNNTVKYYVDRPAAVTWSTTGLYAVLVDLTQDLA